MTLARRFHLLTFSKAKVMKKIEFLTGINVFRLKPDVTVLFQSENKTQKKLIAK